MRTRLFMALDIPASAWGSCLKQGRDRKQVSNPLCPGLPYGYACLTTTKSLRLTQIRQPPADAWLVTTDEGMAHR